MAIAKINAQGISRFLRARGYNPQSNGGSLRRSPALQCQKRALDSVSIRVWADPYALEPSSDDIATAAEIADLLKQNGYVVRYTAGRHFVTVEGKTTEMAKTAAPSRQEAPIMETQHDQDRLDRLPRHAREEIIRLRAEVEHLKGKLTEGDKDSNAYQDPYSTTPRPIGKDPVIRYEDSHREGWLGGFTVQFKDDELRVQGMAPHVDDYLAVFPTGGNTVVIKHVKKDG